MIAITEVAATVAAAATASTRVAGTAVPLPPGTDSLVILMELAGVGGTSALDVYIEESWDGGTNWFEVLHAPQLAGGAAAIVYRASIVEAGAPGLTVTGKNTAAAGVIAANTTEQGPWAPLVRLVARTGAGVPTGGAITQTCRFECLKRSRA